MRSIFAASAVLGLCLSGPVLATKPIARPCLTNTEMDGLVAYFLPNVLTAVSSGCSAHLSPTSYLRNGIGSLMDGLAQGREAAWPSARAAFFKLSDGNDMKSMVSLSDKALRPLVDEVLAQKMTIPVNASMCAETNDIVEALAPLNAAQSSRLIAAVLSAAGRNGSKMRSCPRIAD